MFVVEDVSSGRDSAAGDDFSNENNASSHFAIDLTTYVKAQIHFLEAAMKWKGNAEDSLY